MLARQTDRDAVILEGLPGGPWEQTRTIETVGSASGVAFSADGETAAIGSDGTVTLVPLTGPDTFDAVSIQVGTGNVLRLAFGPDDRWLYTQSYESTRIWPVRITDALALLKTRLQRVALVAPD